jgi:hypothetical protein
LKLIKFVLKDSVPATARKYCVSVTKTDKLMIFRKVILFFSENYTLQNGEVFNIKTNGKQICHLVDMRSNSVSLKMVAACEMNKKLISSYGMFSASFIHVISTNKFIYWQTFKYFHVLCRNFFYSPNVTSRHPANSDI